MAWPFGRKRKGFFDEFDEKFERIREEMERMMQEAFTLPEELGKKGKKVFKEGPFVYGFSMRLGPEGKPVIQEFGNVKPKLKGQEEREPLVDVIEGDKDITVVAEVPGVSKEHIKLRTTEETLSIKVDAAERKYAKTINLPRRVKPQTAKASYKNGVLEVKIEAAEPKKEDKGKEVKVE